MAKQISSCPYDNSTLANFKDWAQTISTWFATAGWVQTSDSGQVDWSTISTVPASGATVFEVWKPGDALTVFYVKVEYGAGGTTPTLGITLGTATNGSGTLTGIVTPRRLFDTRYTPSGSTTYECDFSGANSRIGAILWRPYGTAISGFAIERSKDQNGNDTGTHVTLVYAYNLAGTGNIVGQQSIVFSVGATPAQSPNVLGDVINAAGAFGGMIPLSPVFPNVGQFDYPLTMVGSARSGDIAEGGTYTAMLYGGTRTFLASKQSQISTFGPGGNSNSAFLLRWD